MQVSLLHRNMSEQAARWRVRWHDRSCAAASSSPDKTIRHGVAGEVLPPRGGAGEVVRQVAVALPGRGVVPEVLVVSHAGGHVVS